MTVYRECSPLQLDFRGFQASRVLLEQRELAGCPVSPEYPVLAAFLEFLVQRGPLEHLEPRAQMGLRVHLARRELRALVERLDRLDLQERRAHVKLFEIVGKSAWLHFFQICLQAGA